jgi:DNA-binding NarL/FixJ family response regulator
MYKDPAYFNAALDLGVRGYLLKDSVANELMNCLRVVSQGEHYISPSISHLLVDWKKRSAAFMQTVPALKRLTPAEMSILKLLSENLTNKEMAEKLFVSIRTVENHRLHMCQKLDIKGPHKLLQFALEHKSDL